MRLKRTAYLFVTMIVVVGLSVGCQTGPSSLGGQPFNQGFSGFNVQQTQQSLGQFGRDLGSRFSNGIINQGVNRVLNGVFSGL